MPDWLKRRYMDNEEATAAQREAIDDANADIVKINQRFDADRDRLRQLINGATR